jgi:hypothetical protein
MQQNSMEWTKLDTLPSITILDHGVLSTPLNWANVSVKTVSTTALLLSECILQIRIIKIYVKSIFDEHSNREYKIYQKSHSRRNL